MNIVNYLSEQGIQCSKDQIITPINNFINLVDIKKIKNRNLMVFSSSKLKKLSKKSGIKVIII